MSLELLFPAAATTPAVVTTVTAKVEVAFTTDPLQVVGISDWTDISAYVRGISIRRGRDHELAQSQAGECTIRLRNGDRRFDPLYTSGAYYPNVIPMRQIRVTATHIATTYPLFYGYVENWDQTWPNRALNAAGDAECVLHAVDGFKLLSLYQAQDNYATTVLADGPLAYYKLDEPAGSLLLHDSSANSRDANLKTGSPNGIMMGVTPGPLLGGTSVMDCEGLTGEPSGYVGAMSAEWPGMENTNVLINPVIEFWIKPQTFVDSRIITEFRDQGGIQAFSIQFNGTGGALKWVQYSAGTYTHSATFTISSGVWTHIMAVHDHTNCDWYVNGAFVERTTSGGGAHSFFAGAPALYIGGNRNSSTQPDALIDHVAMYDQDWISPGVVANPFPPARIAAHFAAKYGAIAQTDAGAQMTLLLDMVGWPAGLRTIDHGTTQMAAFDPVGSALGHMLAVAEDSERGLVQMSGDGKVTFHSRRSLEATTGSHGASQATFQDSAGQVGYADIELRYDDQDLWTRTLVAREGGASQIAEDAAAVTKYGPRTLDISATRLVFDEDAQLISRFLLLQYRTPLTRPVSITVPIAEDITTNAAVFGRDTHHDRVTINRVPPGGGSSLSFVAHVEGIEYDISPNEPWQATLRVVPDNGVTLIFDECLVAPGTLDGGVTATVSGTGSSAGLSATAYGGHPGLIDLKTGTTTTGRAGLLGTTDAVQLGALDVYYQGIVYLPLLSTAGETYTVRLGLGDSVSAESVDYIGFRYSHGVNAGEWEGVCRSNSVETARDTNVLVVAATWVKLSFTVNTAGTSVQFYINDVAVGAAVTTNIPTGASRKLTYLPGFIIKSAGTTTRSFLVDRYGYVTGA